MRRRPCKTSSSPRCLIIATLAIAGLLQVLAICLLTSHTLLSTVLIVQDEFAPSHDGGGGISTKRSSIRHAVDDAHPKTRDGGVVRLQNFTNGNGNESSSHKQIAESANVPSAIYKNDGARAGADDETIRISDVEVPKAPIATGSISVGALAGRNKTKGSGKGKGTAPTFENVHDFRRLGPRPRCFEGGSSRRDLEAGRRVYKNSSAQNSAGYRYHHTNVEADTDDDDETFAGVCPGATYAAAWLSTVDTLLANDVISEGTLLTTDPSLEFGFYAATKYPRRPYQTVDMFDFFVHHLSNYEKSLGRSAELGEEVVRLVRGMEDGYRQRGYNNPGGIRNGRVLAVVPFYGGPRGGTRTGLDQGRHFLNVTVMALSNIFPNIVVCVATEDDYDYVAGESGLNRYLYDVQVYSTLESTRHLALATSVRAKSLIVDGTYGDGFDWVYYTEADQLLHVRDVDRLLSLTLEEDTLVVPHRGQPVIHRDDFHEQSVWSRYGWPINVTSKKALHRVSDLTSATCCFDRGCPYGNKVARLTFRDPALELFRQHESLVHVAGTAINMYKRLYRPCRFSNHRHSCIDDFLSRSQRR